MRNPADPEKQILFGAVMHVERGRAHSGACRDVLQFGERRPRAFYAYYNWDVYYLTARGDVRLPVGYDRDRPVPVGRWLAAHPQG